MGMLARIIIIITGCFLTLQAYAFDPITTVLGKGISTALDVRTKEEVKEDISIDVAVTRMFVEQKGDQFKNISLLVFARHGVLVGFAANAEARRKAEQLVKGEKRLRSLTNKIMVGTANGNFGSNLVLDKKIDFKLTATKGVSSVNMRWKVYGGDVFLMGIAQSRKESDFAVKVIKELDGVKAVHSSLRIGKGKVKKASESATAN